MKYQTEFCLVTPASLDRGDGLLCYTVMRCWNKGRFSRLSRLIVDGDEPATGPLRVSRTPPVPQWAKSLADGLPGSSRLRMRPKVITIGHGADGR